MAAAGKLCSWLLLGSLVWLSLVMVAESSGLASNRSGSEDKNMIPLNVQLWLQMLRSKISKLREMVEKKRTCSGFPCIYTHLGLKAGQQARKNSMLAILHKCATNPKCTPGKRRKRSQESLSMLMQQKTTS